MRFSFVSEESRRLSSDRPREISLAINAIDNVPLFSDVPSSLFDYFNREAGRASDRSGHLDSPSRLGQVCLPFYTAVHLSFVKQRRSRLGDLFQLQAAFTARRILADRTKIYFSTSRDARSSKCPVNYLAVIDHLRSRR